MHLKPLFNLETAPHAFYIILITNIKIAFDVF